MKINNTLHNIKDLDENTCKKMIFIFNTIENGWVVKKRHHKYIFRKKHNNSQEIVEESYLMKFIEENSIINT